MVPAKLLELDSSDFPPCPRHLLLVDSFLFGSANLGGGSHVLLLFAFHLLISPFYSPFVVVDAEVEEDRNVRH